MEPNFINNIIHNIKIELLSIYYMDRKGFLKEVEEYILETKNLELIYAVCKEIPEIDMDVYANAIIDSKDAKYNYLFAVNVIDSDAEAHRLVILEAKKRSCLEEEKQKNNRKILRRISGNGLFCRSDEC